MINDVSMDYPVINLFENVSKNGFIPEYFVLNRTILIICDFSGR